MPVKCLYMIGGVLANPTFQTSIYRTISSRFNNVKEGPPIEVFHLTKLFTEDSNLKKVNLGVGAYRDENGKPWVLPVVKKAEELILSVKTLNHEYLPVLGMPKFTQLSVRMLLGDGNPAYCEGNAFGTQALSGTGSLRVAADFLVKHLCSTTFYYSEPTWENHHLVFKNAGFKKAHKYRYWDAKKRDLDIKGMLEDLRKAPKNAVIILHACAHNPTGVDPTPEQWGQIADVIQDRKLLPFFDSAYQGFASGDLDRDATAVRCFVKRGMEIVCAQSYAKNFGLYGERVGNIVMVVNNVEKIPAIKSQLTWIIRGSYSNPPTYGARIVSVVLGNRTLFKEWRENIKTMSSRVKLMRRTLKEELEKINTPGNWDHIVKQIGMFSYTGLTKKQSMALVKEHHVYLLKSGRINVCGLNPNNVAYVAKAFNSVIMKYPAEASADDCGFTDDPCAKKSRKDSYKKRRSPCR